MIVVDANLLAYAILPTSEWTHRAEAALRKNQLWSAPVLWRSEVRNTIAGYLRRGKLSPPQALDAIERAEALLLGGQFRPDDAAVLRLVMQSECSAYDCEYVALAEALHVPLVTNDQKVVRTFPGIAVSLLEFVS